MVYGSFAKGEANEESDVDIAVVVADKLNPNKVEKSLDVRACDGVRNSQK